MRQQLLADEAHIPGQDDQLHAFFLQVTADLLLIFFLACVRFGIHIDMIDAQTIGAFPCLGVFLIDDKQFADRVGDRSILHPQHQIFKVRSASGSEDGRLYHFRSTLPDAVTSPMT